ncbi:XdhC family protein [Castellaniella defragrans]|uniref:Xanthine dehydrogenase accessory factor n=1 Tax=Castellaniella defragrans TaxID=75697 RepID=A0A7W9TQM7_CASDE|nr:XdhC family protein [Castellaniella defragrans]KAB0609442.1 XdhC family protein [Castellaniella defragrans]MBB6084027.1 xanthine dehydrogenase accessory factor [Castellaniella defragrans]
MDNIDFIVLKTLADWRALGRPALLVTVARTWGSSPRPVGSIMALCADGSVIGSVSGGCIEDDLIARYRGDAGGPIDTWHARSGVEVLKYGIQADEAHRFGLPCGGTLELVLEYNPDPMLLDQLIRRLREGRLVRRTLSLDDGRVTLVDSVASDILAMDARTLSTTFGPSYRMLLIGAGQLAEYLATMALFSGFTVTVCDPRIEYTRSWAVAGAVLSHDMPDDAVIALRPDRRTCIVALSHDPKLDDMALMEALNSEAFYVGAIGSRRNQDARHARMIEYLDMTKAAMSRLRGPVGLFIGSKTPAEIAVSIMAEIIAVKNGVPLTKDLDVRAAKNRIQLQQDENMCGLVHS